MAHISLSFRRALTAGCAAILATLGCTLIAAAPAQAAGTTRFVNLTGDDTDNDCTVLAHPCRTIQYAINQANAGDTVQVAKGEYPESVFIRTSLTLVGAGATGSGRTTIDEDLTSGDPNITVDGLDTRTKPDVVIRDIDASGNEDNDGILILNADATIEDTVASNNNDVGIHVEGDSTVSITGTTADGNGDNGVLLQSLREGVKTTQPQLTELPAVTLSNDVVTGNNNAGVEVDTGSASIDHSTIDGNADGGVDVEDGTADVTASTLDGNTGFGAIADGQGTQVTVTTSTVSNTVPFTGVTNASEDFGSGVAVFPGGVGTVDTSTIFGNTGQGVLTLSATAAINNSTISGTRAEPAEKNLPQGGVAVTSITTDVSRAAAKHYGARPASARTTARVAAAPTTTLTGTVVADNTTLADCNGTVVDGGYNLDSDGSCAWSATGSISKGDAKLGPLADNGGPTKTLKPAKGSDAIDAIPTGSANCSTDATDQRGVSRPQGPKCDIGAVEADQPSVVISPNSLPHGTVGVAYHQTITATGGLGAPYVWSLAGGQLPPGLTFSSGGVISGVPTTAGTFHITVSVDDPTEKNYTIVIVAPTGPGSSSSASTAPIANTGTNVVPLSSVGGAAVLIGLLALVLAGLVGRRPGRHRRGIHATTPRSH